MLLQGGVLQGVWPCTFVAYTLLPAQQRCICGAVGQVVLSVLMLKGRHVGG
jgi:hypothetical protein